MPFTFLCLQVQCQSDACPFWVEENDVFLREITVSDKLQAGVSMPLFVCAVFMNQQYHERKKEENWVPLWWPGDTVNQSSLLQCLVSLIKEFKDRLKQKLQENCNSA